MRKSGAPGDPRRIRVFLVGYYGTGNLGDEAIRHAIEQEAAHLGVEILAYANWGRANDGDPRAVRMRGFGLVRYLSACVAADRVVLGGGGILKDEGLRMPFELLLTAVVARLFGRPVALLSVGVGPFYTRYGRAAVKAVARLATYRSVRDQDSADELARLGLSDVEVGADPVFCLTGAKDRVGTVGQASQACRVVVSLRPWFLRQPSQRWEAFVHDMAEVLNALEPQDLELRFAALYWPRDREAAMAVHDHLRRLSVVPAAPSELGDLIAELRSARLTIAMRYHAVLLAASQRCPTVAIAYEPKVAALARQLGIPWVAVDDPELPLRLGENVASALHGRAAPDVARLKNLRDQARRSVVHSLTGC